MNCRNLGEAGWGVRFRSSIVRRITRLSDLFDVCFLDKDLHFLNGRPLLKQSAAAVATSREGQRPPPSNERYAVCGDDVALGQDCGLLRRDGPGHRLSELGHLLMQTLRDARDAEYHERMPVILG